jgi:hypothetical protein
MKYVEVPGIDAIWHQIWTDTISDYPRLASSAAHVYGHPRAFTESFAAYRPEPDINLVRYILNEQFVRGVNLVETMYFPATSTPGPDGKSRGGPAKYMQDPAFPALLTYVRRMSFLMSMGRPAADVALYLPSASMWLGDSASDTQFVSTERLLSEHQIDFDIVDEDFLANSDKPALTTASGNTYSTVIIPNASILADAALTHLRAFAEAGNRVLFLGGTPQLISGRTILDARPATPADFAFATIVPTRLPHNPPPPHPRNHPPPRPPRCPSRPKSSPRSTPSPPRTPPSSPPTPPSALCIASSKTPRSSSSSTRAPPPSSTRCTSPVVRATSSSGLRKPATRHPFKSSPATTAAPASRSPSPRTRRASSSPTTPGSNH